MTYSDAPVPFIGGQAFPLEANTLCRFPSSPRPHMVHCILAVSHSRDRGIYDAIRGVYNAIGHVGCRPAPPFEEWGGIGQLCKHIFCRCACMSLKGDSCFVCFNHSSDRASAFVWSGWSAAIIVSWLRPHLGACGPLSMKRLSMKQYLFCSRLPEGLLRSTPPHPNKATIRHQPRLAQGSDPALVLKMKHAHPSAPSEALVHQRPELLLL